MQTSIIIEGAFPLLSALASSVSTLKGLGSGRVICFAISATAVFSVVWFVMCIAEWLVHYTRMFLLALCFSVAIPLLQDSLSSPTS